MITPQLQRAIDVHAQLDQMLAELMDATGLPLEAIEHLQAVVSRLALAHCCQEFVDAKAKLTLRALTAANA